MFFIPGSPLFIYKDNHLRARRAASDVPKSRVFQLEAVVLIGRDFTYPLVGAVGSVGICRWPKRLAVGPINR